MALASIVRACGRAVDPLLLQWVALLGRPHERLYGPDRTGADLEGADAPHGMRPRRLRPVARAVLALLRRHREQRWVRGAPAADGPDGPIGSVARLRLHRRPYAVHLTATGVCGSSDWRGGTVHHAATQRTDRDPDLYTWVFCPNRDTAARGPRSGREI